MHPRKKTAMKISLTSSLLLLFLTLGAYAQSQSGTDSSMASATSTLSSSTLLPTTKPATATFSDSPAAVTNAALALSPGQGVTLAAMVGGVIVAIF
ncbi:hypothetical protein H0H81_002181 [Sphagnurus paluster]|uniref:Uncharacterized protein n=1 Tax=Sphagnurus paluster TaxID=117069 RepID=A0A9P7KKG2_9AGAR|nr:hypothetical protein H0H81_002181 [Sphagnurus paluster]